MQDYFGTSTTINEGKIGGWNINNLYPSNISYKKKLGFDIQVNNEPLFSFDVEISCKYKRDTISEFATSNVQTAQLNNNNYLVNSVI
jgi:hypothetical protein